MPPLSLSPTHYIPRTKATHQNLHIRNTHDAHIVFEAVRLGALPMVTQRLSIVDCELLHPGQIYCWEQENGEHGIERWTDGRRWCASRARENFLFYIEKSPLSASGEQASAPDVMMPNGWQAAWDFRSNSNSSGFTKQTYSAWVKLEHMPHAQRWNLTAYFSGNDYLHLPTVEDDPLLSRIEVPLGVYMTVQSLLRRSERRITTSGSGYGIRRTSEPRANTSSLSQHPLPLGHEAALREDDILPLAEFSYQAEPGVADEVSGSPDVRESNSSPLPRSPEDNRVLSKFKLQL